MRPVSQKGRPMELNWREARLLETLQKTTGSLTVREAARKCFPGVRPKTKAALMVRNSMRKLVRNAVARRAARGVLEAVR